MARTWGQGRKLPKSSPIGSQTGFLQEDGSGESVDGVKWASGAELAAAAGLPDPSEADDGVVVTVESGEYVLAEAGGGGVETYVFTGSPTSMGEFTNVDLSLIVDGGDSVASLSNDIRFAVAGTYVVALTVSLIQAGDAGFSQWNAIFQDINGSSTDSLGAESSINDEFNGTWHANGVITVTSACTVNLQLHNQGDETPNGTVTVVITKVA